MENIRWFAVLGFLVGVVMAFIIPEKFTTKAQLSLSSNAENHPFLAIKDEEGNVNSTFMVNNALAYFTDAQRLKKVAEEKGIKDGRRRICTRRIN